MKGTVSSTKRLNREDLIESRGKEGSVPTVFVVDVVVDTVAWSVLSEKSMSIYITVSPPKVPIRLEVSPWS